ncbi:MAG: hypothetical protein J5518_03065 [Lachnospiraceae bacterium]|nr:hypothetical protein [Lachnospiraceae bacterium]
MKKAIKIVLGVLGALGLGLVGLILACHFKPGLSDAIADKLYRNKAKSAESALSAEEEAELDRLSVSDLTGEEDTEDPDAGEISGDTDPQPAAELPAADFDGSEETPDENVVVTPVSLQSLADYGLTQEDVLNSKQEYFDDCYEQLSAAKGENTSFYNVVRDSMLAQQVLQSYDDESYRAGFMNKFMDDYKVDTCGWSIDQEELQGGYILVKHNFTR